MSGLHVDRSASEEDPGAPLRACFEQLPMAVVQRRGRVLANVDAPYFVSSVDGLACKILMVSASRLLGRMLTSMVSQAGDKGNLRHAAKLAIAEPKTCVYIAISLDNGTKPPVVIQTCVRRVGQDHIEILLFSSGDHSRALLDKLNGRIVVDRHTNRHTNTISQNSDSAITPERNWELDGSSVNADPNQQTQLVEYFSLSSTMPITNSQLIPKNVGTLEGDRTHHHSS